MAKQYFVKHDGHVAGPYLASQLRQQASDGTLATDAEISEDQQHWVCAAHVKGLSFHSVNVTDRQVEASVLSSPAATQPAASSPPHDVQPPPSTEYSPTMAEGQQAAVPLASYARTVTDRLRDFGQTGGVQTVRIVGEMLKRGSYGVLSDHPAPQVTPSVNVHEPKFDVFLSYRRRGGSEIARLVAERLERQGYEVFLDVEGLAEGDWSAALEHQIEQCHDFVPIITQDFFARCEQPDDVVRKEIALALSKGKNVVPVIATENPFPETLPDDIASLREKNGVRYVHEHANHVFNKLSFMLHSGRLGPARLDTPELQPRIVVASVAVLLGLSYGNFAVWLPTNPFVSVFTVLFTSATAAFSSVLMFALPLLLIQTFVTAIAKVRPDNYYGGRSWAAFWIMFCPLVAMPTAFLVPFAIWILAHWTFNFGPDSSYATPSTLTRVIASIFGVLIALVVMQLVVKTKAWTAVGRTVGLSRWV